MSSQPIERSENTTDNSIILKHYNQPSESIDTKNPDDSDATKHKHKKTNDQSSITFYCDFHKKVFKLSPTDMYNHYKIHEEEIILLSDYEKVLNTELMDLYEKNFQFEVMDPFEGSDLTETIDFGERHVLCSDLEQVDDRGDR